MSQPKPEKPPLRARLSDRVQIKEDRGPLRWSHQYYTLTCSCQFCLHLQLNQACQLIILFYYIFLMQCNVCTEPYNSRLSTKIPIVLGCGHSLCTLCLESLKLKECPVCRCPIQTKTKNLALLEILDKDKNKKRDTPTKKNIEELFKVSIVGSSSVGKTTILNYIAKGEFSVDTIPTIGVDFMYIDREFDGKIYRIQLWDTAGQEQYRSIAKSHYINSDVIILTYSLNELNTFEELQNYWISEIQQIAPEAKIFLIGNKSDLPLQVSQQRIEKFASEINANHCQISCKNHEGVLMAWEAIVRYIYAKRIYRPKKEHLRIRARQQPRVGFFQGLRDCFSFLFN